MHSAAVLGNARGGGGGGRLAVTATAPRAGAAVVRCRAPLAATASATAALRPPHQQQQQPRRAVRASAAKPAQQQAAPSNPFTRLALPHLQRIAQQRTPQPQPQQRTLHQQQQQQKQAEYEFDAHHQQQQQQPSYYHHYQQQQQQQGARRHNYSSSSGRPAPAIVYLPNFLHPDDAAVIAAECRALTPRLRPELNTVAVGRTGAYLSRGSAAVRILTSPEVAAALTERLRAPAPLAPSDYPFELRAYGPGAHMPWHKDEQLYAEPQWELVYTVDNASDSVTQWRDAAGALHEQATAPNSLLAVLAEAWDHRVTPVRRGRRSIVKFAYTSTPARLPSFAANLDREAYAL